MAVQGFQLAEHPWLSLLIVVLAEAIGMVFFAVVVISLFKRLRGAPMTTLIHNLLGHILVLFVLVPFVFGLPGGTRSFSAYVEAIRLSQVQPFPQLLLLGLSCSLILALCAVCSTLLYRMREGKAITRQFVRGILDVSGQLPPKSWDVLYTFPCVFEEVAYRGVILALFLRFYDPPQAVLFSALGFGASHALNLVNGRAPVWVAGQVVWAAILGLFYGYVTLKTGSLLPAMLVHYLGNLFIAPFIGYVNTSASAKTQAVYGIVFSSGLVPTTLMILWVILFTTLWPVLG